MVLCESVLPGDFVIWVFFPEPHSSQYLPACYGDFFLFKNALLSYRISINHASLWIPYKTWL